MPSESGGRSKHKKPPPNVANFSNFDILWFDLSTKVREMFLDLNQPIIDKIYQ